MKDTLPLHNALPIEEQGIGAGSKNLVGIYDAADLSAWLRDPAAVPVRELPPATGDGEIDATELGAGSYLLVVDTDGLGTGEFSVCVGPGPDPTDEDGTPLDVSTLPAVTTGTLRCSDTDSIPLASATDHTVDIQVRELEGVPGSVHATLLVEDGNNPGVFVEIDDKSSSGKVTFKDIEIEAGASYRLDIDNTALGTPDYEIVVTDATL